MNPLPQNLSSHSESELALERALAGSVCGICDGHGGIYHRGYVEMRPKFSPGDGWVVLVCTDPNCGCEKLCQIDPRSGKMKVVKVSVPVLSPAAKTDRHFMKLVVECLGGVLAVFHFGPDLIERVRKYFGGGS